MAQKFYVVWAGRRTGIFTDWPTTQAAIDKFTGARFKSFATRADAEAAFGGGEAKTSRQPARQESSRAGKSALANGQLNCYDVSIYCDGACDPNPGHAGSGIVVYRSGQLSELWFGLYNPRGTNNTAELNALYHALRMAKAEIDAGNTVEIRSDSAYSINCIRTWAPGWEKKGWTKPGGEIKNLEIIQECYALYGEIKKDLSLTHVAAHVGTEGNELADRMAMLAATRRVRELMLYEQPYDIPALLRMRAG